MRGKFITIEGIEGVGKSTNIEYVAKALQAKGVELIQSREPGGTPLAEELREVLLKNRNEAVDPTAELLMVFSARAQHLNTLIRPSLESGVWVLCDRFTDATYAYQGYGRSLPIKEIQQLENLVQKGLQPDLTIYLDIEVEVGLERARKRGELDRFEKEEVEFFERVSRGYRERIKQNPERYAVVDAGQPLELVQIQIQKILDSLV